MPREVVTRGGREFAFRTYALPALGPHEVRVRVEFAAPKHGTERHSILGSPADRKRWDPELRMFLPRPEGAGALPTEREMGNMVVGVVDECGSEASSFRPGDRVFGYGRIRELHQAGEDRLYPLGDLAVEDAVCTDPAHVAFVAVRDGNIRVGDRVAVFGLGAIGLMAVQIARVAGADPVFAVDPLAIRRAAALRLGAAAALDPAAADVALAVKEACD
ncbi:MAG: alcohol dehydrogenase, partial [Armatimonadetes bacterium]|nr:alcohol dehydrogenase [Armatimonadota bacterium]